MTRRRGIRQLVGDPRAPRKLGASRSPSSLVGDPRAPRRLGASRSPSSRDVVILLVAALLFYIALLGIRGVSLLGDHRWAVKLLGVGVLLLPLVGVAIIAAEIRFGRAANRLGMRVDDEPEAPAEELTPDPDAAFERAKICVEADPENWRGWYWLAIGYSEARDPGRARRTMRKAIAMERATPGADSASGAALRHEDRGAGEELTS